MPTVPLSGDLRPCCPRVDGIAVEAGRQTGRLSDGYLGGRASNAVRGRPCVAQDRDPFPFPQWFAWILIIRIWSGWSRVLGGALAIPADDREGDREDASPLDRGEDLDEATRNPVEPAAAAAKRGAGFCGRLATGIRGM